MCNGGCCDGTTCQMGNTNAACGTNGGACNDCSATCNPGPLCLAGGTCGCTKNMDCNMPGCPGLGCNTGRCN